MPAQQAGPVCSLACASCLRRVDHHPSQPTSPSHRVCSLHSQAARLGGLPSLEHLVLDGNSVDDTTLQHVADLPRLRRLSLRQSTRVSDAGLRHLAARRGSRLAPRGANAGAGNGAGPAEGGGEGDAAEGDAAEEPAGGSSGASGASGSSGRDLGLVELDISGCTGLTDLCWLAITEVRRGGLRAGGWGLGSGGGR